MGNSSGFGAANGDGTVFSLPVGLGPFVETLPTSCKVGAVKILGTDLTGATSATFNRTAAISTTVPPAPPGNLYGTTYGGSSNCSSVYGCGVVFKLEP